MKISVLIPCFNVEKYVSECLRSVISQTYKNLEIICVNDGATDSTLSILRDFSNKDDRITIINKENSGYGDSMNVALNSATGDYIAIVEPDDFVEEDMFERLLDEAIKHDLDISRGCYFEYNTSDGSNAYVSNAFVTKNEVYEPLINQSPFYQGPSIWAAIYKRSMLEQNNIRFLSTPGASFQDTAFAFKVYCCAKRFKMIDKAFLHYRIDNANSSVKSPGKVYCVCDEYEEIWRFAREDKERFEKVKYLIPVIERSTFAWNYNRLSCDLRVEFLKKWSTVLQKEIGERLICWSKLSLKKRLLLCRIAYLPFTFKRGKRIVF